MRLQRRRRGLVGRIGGRAKVGEFLAHALVLHAVLQRADELVEDRLWRALGRVERVPDAHLEALQALLLERGNLGQRRHALR